MKTGLPSGNGGMIGSAYVSTSLSQIKVQGIAQAVSAQYVGGEAHTVFLERPIILSLNWSSGNPSAPSASIQWK